MEWIQQVLNSDQGGITVVFAVFLLGVVGVLSCGCNFAIIGIIAGYSGTLGSTGKTKAVILSGIFFLLGTIISMALIGGIIGYASEIISDSFGNYWKAAAGLISILFGLYALGLTPFKIPALNINSGKSKDSIFSSILFGLTIGGLATAFNSCCNPVFPIVLAATFIKGSMLWGILLLISFALGYGLPLTGAIIGIGLGLGKISKSLSRFGKIINYISGAILLVLGFYFLLTI